MVATFEDVIAGVTDVDTTPVTPEAEPEQELPRIIGFTDEALVHTSGLLTKLGGFRGALGALSGAEFTDEEKQIARGLPDPHKARLRSWIDRIGAQLTAHLDELDELLDVFEADE